MQTGVSVDGNKITGTLKLLSEGSLVETFGEGNFLALKFDIPDTAVSVKVGLDPSEGTGMQEIIDDPDRNGAWKITDNEVQEFKVVTVDKDGDSKVDTYDLSELICHTE